MVQRKDSLCYIEFLRGKWTLQNRAYILRLFDNMTPLEKCSIKTKDFDTLWKDLWQINDCRNYVKEYTEAKCKFTQLKNGYKLRTNETSVIDFNFDYVLENCNNDSFETEWGFAKGKRQINESDSSCALREFHEETGIDLRNITMLKDFKPVEEVFTGSNKIRYKHVYYVSHWQLKERNAIDKLIPNREIRTVSWFKYHDAQVKIHENNIERKELFRRVNQYILKKICSNYKSYVHSINVV